MTRIPSLVFAAGAVLALLLLSACASASVGASGARFDDIVRIPLGASEPVTDKALRVRREEALRRELGVDRALDGSWDGCFMRGFGAGC